MKYRALDANLVSVAEAARKYFMRTEGAKRFRAEEEIAQNLRYRPTLFGQTEDYGVLAVEVNEGVYTDALDRFVLECLDLGLPIRLFVAAPSGSPEGQKLDLVRRAKKRSIGLVEVDGENVTRLLPALSLSLTGVRPIDKKRFPKAYHARLQQAEETFRNGDAAKGCGRVYDLIEKRTRAIAAEIAVKSIWRPLKPGESLPKLRTNTPWQKVMETIDDYANFQALKSHGLEIDKPLWARLRGLTPHRNDTGHEPTTREELLQRDRELRTRFEHALDTLADLAEASPKIAG